jgi:hypothetical protein
MVDLLGHLHYVDDSNQVQHHSARMRGPGRVRKNYYA